MGTTGRPGALAKRIGFIALTAGLALAAAWEAAATAMSGPNPAMIYALDRTNPLVLPMIVDQFSAVDNKPGMPRETFLEPIRESLRREPLVPRALRQLAAWDDAHDRPEASRALLEVGARVGRRDPLLNIMLAKDAAKNNEEGLALSHLDAALSTFPAADREVFPLLAGALADPSLRNGMKGYMARPWAEPFMLFAAQNADPVGVLDLALSAPQVQTSPRYERVRSELVSHLARGGAADRAIAYVRKVAPKPNAFRNAGVTAATTDPLFAPVTWRLRNDNGVYVTAEGGKLIVSLDPAARGRALERIFDLSPGRYGLSVVSSVPAGSDVVVATWTANCLRGKDATTLASREAPIATGRVALDLAVPAGCDAVQVLLDLVSRSDQQPVEYAIDSIRLARKDG